MKKPENFKKQAESSSDVTLFQEFPSTSKVWDYYYNYTGKLKGSYFCIYFSSIAGKERIEISELTENVEEFKKYFWL